MDWSPKSTAMSWAGWAIAQPIISPAFFFLAFTTVQLNLFTTATLGQTKSDRFREV